MSEIEKRGGILHPGVAASTAAAGRNNNVYKGPPLFFIMMRLNLKVALTCLCVMVLFVTVLFWSLCGDVSRNLHQNIANGVSDAVGRMNEFQVQAEEIDCHINGEYVIGCRKEGGEVYIPFSFIHKYFEISGKLATYDGLERFEWSHTNNKVYYPKNQYDPRGVFMYFENYNVEVRDRVKCISAKEGVPISIQWESQGYYYPTQIAQFGLAHYSKNLTEPEPHRRVIADGEEQTDNWIVPEGCSLHYEYDHEIQSKVLEFTSPDFRSVAITLPLDHVLDFVLSMDIRFKANASITVSLLNRESVKLYNIHYILSAVPISVKNNNIYYGVGSPTAWKHVTRDLVIDVQKGLALTDKQKRKVSRSKLKLVGIAMRGHGAVDNIALSSSEHISQFYDAARWFVKHQDKNGGWANPVRRRVASGFSDLHPGWYSAMGQGHAISVLARAYHHSRGDVQYLNAAINGLKPFRVPSAKGGVLAYFLDKYGWYEEYPTQPPSFVLNGFIYSLLGLYDLMTIAPPNQTAEARILYDRGMKSLKRLLLLYDTGSGTSYDLRHITLGVAPNLARWDYHATHVNQLLLLSTIDSDPLLSRTADRWLGYMSGKRAAHN